MNESERVNQEFATDATPWSPGEKPGVYARRVLLLLVVAWIVLWGASYIEGLFPVPSNRPEISRAEAIRRIQENVQRNIVEHLRVAGIQLPEDAKVRLPPRSGQRSDRGPVYRRVTIDFHTHEYLNHHEYEFSYERAKSQNKYGFERWVLVHRVTGKLDLIEAFTPLPSEPMVALRDDPRSYLSRKRWYDARSILQDGNQPRSRRVSESRVFQAAVKTIFFPTGWLTEPPPGATTPGERQ